MTELLDSTTERPRFETAPQGFVFGAAMQQKLVFIDALEKAVNNPGWWRLAAPVSCSVLTFWGDAMNVVLPEAVSNEIANTGVYESDLSIGFIQLVEAGATVFDVGAHRGYFTMLAARLAGPTGQVHSFEPTPSTFEILESNAKHLPGVHLNNLAVYSQSTELMLRDYGLIAPAFNSIYNARLSDEEAQKLFTGSIRVKAVSLDDYVASTGAKPDLIKIDAESAEKDILNGMRNILATIRPAFTLETGDMNVEGVCSTRELVDFACSFGYTPIEMKNGKFSAHEKQDVYSYSNLLFMADEKVGKS